MTREEALQHFKEQLDIFGGEHAEAIKVAIEALKRVSFENDTEIKSCSKDSDLISRAEVIEALRYAQHRFTVADEAGGMGSVKWSENVIYFAAAERVLTELPSADRPKGEWIAEEEYGDLWICDQCGFASEHNDNFCPNCGADMRGDTK